MWFDITATFPCRNKGAITHSFGVVDLDVVVPAVVRVPVQLEIGKRRSIIHGRRSARVRLLIRTHTYTPCGPSVRVLDKLANQVTRQACYEIKDSKVTQNVNPVLIARYRAWPRLH